MPLTGSVGSGGLNELPDVKMVQRLLNDALVRAGKIKLKVDGLAGPLTIDSIEWFQQMRKISA